MRKIDSIIIHQSDTVTGTVAAIRKYHMEVMGWSDIGYHYLIQPNGRIDRGRTNSKVGAHCQGDNAASIGICCIGKGAALPVGQGYMTPSQWNSLVSLVRIVMRAYGVKAARVWGHRERPSGKSQGKTCPGFDVSVLRKELSA